MPICDCSGINTEANQTIFLGCSIAGLSASVGWNTQGSTLQVTLIEDVCDGPKEYWDECLLKQSYSGPDFGFFGEPRWQDGSGNEYSSCLPKSVSDTLVRDAIDLIGVPAFLRLGDFEWCGIITDWQKREECPQTYTVNLTDPRVILQSVYLITSDYAGRIDQVGTTGCPTPNLFNVYGYMEQFGTYCPEQIHADDGLVFGSPFNGFGGSLWNEDGMPWNQVLLGFNLLANAIPQNVNVFSPYGRVSYYKPIIPVSLAGQAAGLMYPHSSIGCYDAFDYYFVDLSELPVIPNSYRLNSSSTSLMEAIDKLAQDFGFDYYVDLVPVLDEILTPCVKKFIKIRVVYRTTQPSTDAICQFIQQAQCVSSAQTGKELRSEISSKFLIGSNKYTILQVSQDDNPDINFTNPSNDEETLVSINPCVNDITIISDSGCPAIDDSILPYFGTYPNRDLVKVCKVENDPSGIFNGLYSFFPSTEEINTQLAILSLASPTIEIFELELVAALRGKDAWMTWIETVDTDTSQAVIAQDKIAVMGLSTVAEYIQAENIAGRDLQNPNKRKAGLPVGSLSNDYLIVNDIQELYDWVLKFARDYYGKQWAVRVPFSCCYPDPETGRLRIANEPTNEGGWTETATVLGLGLGSDELQFFRNPDGRIQCFCAITTSPQDITHLGTEDYLQVSGDILYLKCSVKEEYVFYDADCCYAPRVVVELPQAVTEYEFGDSVQIHGLSKLFDGANQKRGIVAAGGKEAQKEAMQKNAGSTDGNFNLAPLAIQPSSFAIPIKHHTISYGPWTQPSNTGAQIELEVNQSLNPWTFGSAAGMNAAAQFLVNSAQLNMKVGETGSITVPGYPTLPLGAELGAVGGGFYGGGSYLVENRSSSTNSYSGYSYENYNLGDMSTNPSGDYVQIDYESVSVGNWSGIYGPNITSISVDVGCPPTTTYNMRTFSPRRLGVDKQLIERLQKLNTFKNNQVEYLRSLLRTTVSRFNKRLSTLSDYRQQIYGRIEADHSPHIGFIGNNKVESDDTIRPIIVSDKTANFSQEMQVGYDNKAMMSIDGLLRPISLDGDGGLPRLIKYNTKVLSIHQDDLNPMTNPSGWSRSHVAAKRSDTPTIGHDYELLARGNDANGSLNPTPSGGLLMRIASDFQGENGIDDAGDYRPAKADYRPDYRAFALKGPVLLQSWGYDTLGYPVPNKVDTISATQSGIFEDDPNLLNPTKFMDNHLMRPDSWVVAPIDFRLDRQRGVWVAGSAGEITATAVNDCVLDNLGNIRWAVTGCDNEAAYSVKSNNLCFGKGITLEIPCSGDDLQYTVDPSTGDIIPCTPNIPNGASIDYIKVGAAIDIAFVSAAEDADCISECGCLADEALTAPGFPGEYGYPYFREGSFNRILLDGGGFVTKYYPDDPCKVRLGTNGRSGQIHYINPSGFEIRCHQSGGDGNDVVLSVHYTKETANFTCGLFQDITPTVQVDQVLCTIKIPNCCDEWDSYSVVGLDGSNGPPVTRELNSGVTYMVNGTSGNTVDFTVNADPSANTEVTALSATGNYFKPGGTISPSIPHTIPAGTSQTFSIQVSILPSSTELKTGFINIEIDSLDNRLFGVQGLIE